MSTERRPQGAQAPAPGHTAVDVRALLKRRDYIKTAVFLLSHRGKRQVLELMERLRQARRPVKRLARTDGSPRLPEMTGTELVREINWRLGTLPPSDAIAVAECVRRLSGWRERRAGRVSSTTPGR